MGRDVVVAVTASALDFGPWEQIFYGESTASARTGAHQDYRRIGRPYEDQRYCISVLPEKAPGPFRRDSVVSGSMHKDEAGIRQYYHSALAKAVKKKQASIAFVVEDIEQGRETLYATAKILARKYSGCFMKTASSSQDSRLRQRRAKPMPHAKEHSWLYGLYRIQAEKPFF